MARGKQYKNKLETQVNLTQRPWWNFPLIQTILAGIFILIGVFIQSYISRDKTSFDQKVIESSQISYIDFNLAKFRFNSENKNLFDVMLPVHINGAANASVYFNRGNGYEIIASSKEKSDFPVIISHLQCNSTYFFRIDPVLNGKTLKGVTSNFHLPNCKTPEERKNSMNDAHYTDSFYVPNLEIVG